jgi:hypothetical protein
MSEAAETPQSDQTELGSSEAALQPTYEEITDRKGRLKEGDRLTGASGVWTVNEISKAKYGGGEFHQYEIEDETGAKRVTDDEEVYGLVKSTIVKEPRGNTVLTPSQATAINNNRSSEAAKRVAELASEQLDRQTRGKVDLGRGPMEGGPENPPESAGEPPAEAERESVPRSGDAERAAAVHREAEARQVAHGARGAGSGARPEDRPEAAPKPEEQTAQPQTSPEIAADVVHELKNRGWTEEQISELDRSQAVEAAAMGKGPPEKPGETPEHETTLPPPERSPEPARPGPERTVRELSPEEERDMRERLQKKTQKGYENPYVRGAEKGGKYIGLDDKVKMEFRNITDAYVVQKDTEDETLDINSPLTRALDRYGNFEPRGKDKEDNFKTAQDTMNALYALRLIREENVPQDMERDIKKLEGKLIDNLKVDDKQGLARIFSRRMPNSRAAYADERWLGEDVDAEELLIKGLNAKTEGIIHESAGRDERPSEPEQTPEQQELYGMMEKLMKGEDIDPSRLEEITPSYIEQAKAAGVSQDMIQDLERAAGAYAEEKKSDRLKLLLMLLFVIGGSIGEVTRRR